MQADVSQKADAERLAAETVDAFGAIDSLVNNAGIIRPGPSEDLSLADWRATHDYWEKGAVQNRIGEPDELIGAVVCLASDSASFTTGEILTIDGGLTLR